jgi:uncharacterized protein YecE (DUF72 family)
MRDQGLLFEAVRPAPAGEALRDLGAALRARWGGRLHLGTSSWHFPGWAGSVWDRPYPPPVLSREGLAAYAQHPLLNCVSLDRAFYRPLDEGTYRRLAAQVGQGFGFVVKAPAIVTDAQLRMPGSGAPSGDNPAFLDAGIAVEQALRPALAGLAVEGDSKLGAIVFQLSPLPARWLDDERLLHSKLRPLLAAVAMALAGSHRGKAPPPLAALEVRDAGLLTPGLAALLREHRWRCCLGLHDRLPEAAAQRPMQRALWPGDLVCRWNLQIGQRYARARDAWAPFDRLQAPDPATRTTLARIARATLDAGHRVFITINNKAEGSAPASVVELARLLNHIDQ